MTGTYTPDWIQNDLNYTFSQASSVGISQFRVKGQHSDRDYLIPRFSHRLRKNGLGYQGNFYTTAGIGSRLDQDNSNLAGYAAFQADFETRRIYTLGLAESLFDGDGQPRTHLQYRLGFAPYQTHFDGLSTWLIGQLDYKGYDKDDLSFSPLIRLFFENILVETGVSLQGDMMVTFMYSF